ncbi:MAG: hypothetical protein LBR53_00380 [Deltaproteobacteria bacterium]|jgi:hypothetical protein|nr:hypothetical protein [Deltaproteobacteria bacterium]
MKKPSRDALKYETPMIHKKYSDSELVENFGYIIKKETAAAWLSGFREGKLEVKLEGMREGKRKIKIAVAEAMIKENFELETIARISGLNMKEITALRDGKDLK